MADNITHFEFFGTFDAEKYNLSHHDELHEKVSHAVQSMIAVHSTTRLTAKCYKQKVIHEGKEYQVSYYPQ